MIVLKLIAVLSLVKLLDAFGKAPIEIAFFIRSQNVHPHNQLSHHLKQNLTQQFLWLHSDSDSDSDYNMKVYIIHELFNFPGDWNILHLIPHLLHGTIDDTKHADVVTKLIRNHTQWIVFCEDTTTINVQQLVNRLSEEKNYTQPMFLGYALYDQEPTIIHHFAFAKNPHNFPYPMLSAGIVLNLALLKSVDDALNKKNNNNNKQLVMRSEFSIDAEHELARFIYDNVKIPPSTQHSPLDQFNLDVEKVKMPIDAHHRRLLLKRTSYICPRAPEDTKRFDRKCVMFAASTPQEMNCNPLRRDEIYFAVKTFSKYHKDRLPVIQQTWGLYAKHIKYFSDVQDEAFGTTATDVPNVEVGHCSKTLQILKMALKDITSHNEFMLDSRRRNLKGDSRSTPHSIKWLLLADDDTLLSVSGVCQVLGCFNASEKIYLGERYGYRLYAPDGFNYITGGGGIAFSLNVLKLIVQHCSCPTSSAPDDMILGSCLHSLQLKAIHSARFHQARPFDYSEERLRHDRPISFHKFLQLNPYDVYHQWFFDEDDRLLLMEAHDFVPNEAEVLEETNIYKLKSSNSLVHPKELAFNEWIPLLSTWHDAKERHIDL